MKKWHYYLLPKEFVLFTNHKALQYINDQGKLNQKHSKCVEFLKSYSFIFNQRFGKSNKAIDALSHRIMLLNDLLVEIFGLECVRELYVEDADLAEAWKAYKTPWSMDRTTSWISIFKNKKLFIP